MGITILQPKPASYHVESRDDSGSDTDSDGGIDLDGDVSMSSKALRHADIDLVTPGELITDDAQWMRFVRPS